MHEHPFDPQNWKYWMKKEPFFPTYSSDNPWHPISCVIQYLTIYEIYGRQAYDKGMERRYFRYLRIVVFICIKYNFWFSAILCQRLRLQHYQRVNAIVFSGKKKNSMPCLAVPTTADMRPHADCYCPGAADGFGWVLEDPTTAIIAPSEHLLYFSRIYQ